MEAKEINRCSLIVSELDKFDIIGRIDKDYSSKVCHEYVNMQYADNFIDSIHALYGNDITYKIISNSFFNFREIVSGYLGFYINVIYIDGIGYDVIIFNRVVDKQLHATNKHFSFRLEETTIDINNKTIDKLICGVYDEIVLGLDYIKDKVDKFNNFVSKYIGRYCYFNEHIDNTIDNDVNSEIEDSLLDYVFDDENDVSEFDYILRVKDIKLGQTPNAFIDISCDCLYHYELFKFDSLLFVSIGLNDVNKFALFDVGVIEKRVRAANNKIIKKLYKDSIEIASKL